MQNYLVLVCLVSISCASAPKNYDVERSVEFEESFDDVWRATVETFTAQNLPIDNIEKDSGIIVTDWMRFVPADEIADCGSPGGLNTLRDRRIKFNVFVRPIENETTLTVNTAAEAMSCFQNNCNPVSCNSTGNLERRIQTGIETRL